MTDRSDPILDELMEAVSEATLATAQEGELRIPLMACRVRQGRILTFPLGPSQVHPAEIAQVLLYLAEATHVAIGLESWGYELPVTPESAAAFRQGVLPPDHVRPSQHPDRFDLLLVIGEARGAPQRGRSWRIMTDPTTGARTFAPPQEIEAGTAMPARFTPLFADEAHILDLIRHHAAVEHLLDLARDAQN
jgi:hypothetical protein